MAAGGSALDDPILNSPYDAPERHFAIGPAGPTGEIKPGRRPSESFIPVPVGRKHRSTAAADADQQGFDFDATGERREVNELINDIRGRVELWRAGGQDPYARLKRALKADIDEDAWSTLYQTTSRPFPIPTTGKIAVKVINDYGDEVVKVYEV